MFRKMSAQRSLIVRSALLAVGLVWAALSSEGPVQAQQAGTKMHITAMGGAYLNTHGPKRLPYMELDVRDEFGNRVSGATVTGNWSGCITLNGASAVTDQTGRATVYGKEFTFRTPCSATFSVTNISKSGMTYDANANVIASSTEFFQ